MPDMQGVFTLSMEAGIQRDGTAFRSPFWSEGQWVRFQRGVPKKMLGYKEIADYTDVTRIVRGLSIIPEDPNYNIYYGDSDQLRYITIDADGNRFLVPPVDRTPVGFVPDPAHNWTFDIMYNALATGPFPDQSLLIAYAGLNLNSIDSQDESPVYYGAPDDPFNPLVPLIARIPGGGTEAIVVSGGILVMHPFLFVFGNNGSIRWSGANDPTNFTDQLSSGPVPLRIASKKVIAGRQTRGGQTSPAGVFWTLDSVIRATFNSSGTGSTFIFDTVTDQASILSANAIVEIDGLFFWPAVDRFLVYNGTVQEVPNDKNLNYFFQNLNYAAREKVWATKVTEFGEVWWFYPSGISTECDKAVIYNYREKTWYDTEINRTCGDFAQVFTNPIWAGSDLNDGHNSIWEQETGVNVVSLNLPIRELPFYITSGSITYCANGPSGGQQWTGIDRWVLMTRFEPDFIQKINEAGEYGIINLTISGRNYAQAPIDTTLPPFDIKPDTDKIDMMIQYREMNITISGDQLNSYFEMGLPLLHLKIGDGRQ